MKVLAAFAYSTVLTAFMFSACGQADQGRKEKRGVDQGATGGDIDSDSSGDTEDGIVGERDSRPDRNDCGASSSASSLRSYVSNTGADGNVANRNNMVSNPDSSKKGANSTESQYRLNNGIGDVGSYQPRVFGGFGGFGGFGNGGASGGNNGFGGSNVAGDAGSPGAFGSGTTNGNPQTPTTPISPIPGNSQAQPTTVTAGTPSGSSTALPPVIPSSVAPQPEPQTSDGRCSSDSGDTNPKQIRFIEIEPLIKTACANCHPTYDTEASWKSNRTLFLTRISDGSMPRSPTTISEIDRQKLLDFLSSL